MRPVREITAEEENFRTEQHGNFILMRRDPVEPEPVGSIVLMAFRITKYKRDCDGSLMATLEAIDNEGNETGVEIKNIGLYPSTEIVASLEEWQAMFKPGQP